MYAPPAIVFLQLLHFQMPTTSRLTASCRIASQVTQVSPYAVLSLSFTVQTSPSLWTPGDIGVIKQTIKDRGMDERYWYREATSDDTVHGRKTLATAHRPNLKRTTVNYAKRKREAEVTSITLNNLPSNE